MATEGQAKNKLKRFIRKLELIRGRHTELVSVYVPADYDMNKIINHLQQEQGTASNIKDKTTRQSVIDSLERMIRHLRLFKGTPKNGLAVFSGNISEREGKPDIQVWSMEPPEPLKIRMYRCDQMFITDPLKEFIEYKESYGLIVMDNREATVGLLKGSLIAVLHKMTSGVPGKIKAGGQCLIKDTLVQCCGGDIVQIKNLHNPFILKSMSVGNFSLTDSPITDKWDVKKTQTYKIITKYPRLEIQSSKDHIFFVATPEGIVEKAANELEAEDSLIMPEIIKVEGMVQMLRPGECYNSFIVNSAGRKILLNNRLEKGLLQRQLAKKIGITQTAISFVEIGKVNVNRVLLHKICDELGLNFEEFLKDYTVPSSSGKPIRLPGYLDKTLAQFLGYLIGDGCIETDRITFFEQSKDLALNYKKTYDNYFGINSSYKFRESKNYHQIRFASRPLVRLILEQFPEIKKTLNSLIPEKVLKSPDDCLAYFLRGLFDADGYASESSGRIGLGINNKLLAQQVQLSLLRFSIISSLHEYDNRRNIYSDKPRFSISITEKQSLNLFRKHIGFSCDKKSKRLDNILKNKAIKNRSRQILLSGSNIRSIIERAGYNLQLFPRVRGFFWNKRGMSKEVFKSSILNMVTDKKLHSELEKIYNCPFIPVKISSIETTNSTIEMVDISVRNQNFIANGVIVHNSAARYSRLREGAAKEFYNRIAEIVNKEFLPMQNLKGILIGGPGPTKEKFFSGNFINNNLKVKTLPLQDIGYTDEYGLHDLVDKSRDLLAQEAIIQEKKIMEKFFTMLAKEEKKVAYGKAEIDKVMEMRAVDTLLLSEALDDSIIEAFEEKCEQTGTELQVISTDTREGVQLRDIGGYAAILRFQVY